MLSNALGTSLPVRERVEMAHRHGAVVLVDSAQGASHMPVDVQALGCDFYALSGHKIFAPTGIGALFGRASILEAMPPWAYERELRLFGEDRLVRVPGLKLVGTAAEKAGVISFVLDGVRTEDVGAALDQEGTAVRSGHHCAQPILSRFGVESSVRASSAPYNTREDIEALDAALRRLQAGRG